ncbi:MAG: phage head closure protein [Planctomycetales bacterium]|nr:phage head closure protein [Planctomycetales bacterium]
MNPRQSRSLLVIEQPVDGNELDGIPAGWQEIRREWGYIQPVDGREYEQSQQMRSDTTHKIATRWFDGATSAMRLVCGPRIFNATSVVNQDERNRWLEWRCVEVAV